MPQDRVIHGVPMALQHDSWWLSGDTAPPQRSTHKIGGPVFALLGLVALADFLFYNHAVGLSLAVFALALFAATLRASPRPAALTLLVASAAPVVDFVQPLSVLILIGGLVTSIALGHLAQVTPTSTPTSTPAATPTATLQAVIALARHIASRAVSDLFTSGRDWRFDLSATGLARRMTRAWAFPLGGTLILLALLAEANPILADWLTGPSDLPFDPVAWLDRALFWGGMALVIWPFLVVPHPSRPALLTLPRPRLPALGLNAASVANALGLFNAVLGVQSLMDLRYLWSAAALPAGMTLAGYAHRGAYPLLATALLAGAFALAARPWLAERKGLKLLLLLWLAQNVMLTLSAIYRLDLYVQSYGLTYLRVYAGIWMALVAAGLCLTRVQVAAGRSNLWLLTGAALLGTTTLYLCAFINIADIIASVNVAEGQIDAFYLCSLGPTAAAAIPQGTVVMSTGQDSFALFDRTCTLAPPRIDGWRDWGFRNWLVLGYLKEQEVAHEDPRR